MRSYLQRSIVGHHELAVVASNNCATVYFERVLRDVTHRGKCDDIRHARSHGGIESAASAIPPHLPSFVGNQLPTVVGLAIHIRQKHGSRAKVASGRGRYYHPREVAYPFERVTSWQLQIVGRRKQP